MGQKQYIAIDLKSFYASVECRERGLDPLSTCLVVADPSRTEKTICLAVTPALKRYGIPGRARLFEVVQRVKEVNRERLLKAPGHRFSGKSCDAKALDADPSLELDFITAPPQMAHYMQRSTEIVDIYLKYVSFEDMHVYSVDEVFIDATGYLEHHVGLELLVDIAKLLYTGNESLYKIFLAVAIHTVAVGKHQTGLGGQFYHIEYFFHCVSSLLII